MRKVIQHIYSVVFLFCIVFSVHAGSSLKDTLDIQEVVVTATKTRVNKNNTPLSISVVTRQEIERSSESALLPVLSQRVPGLFVTQRGITGFGVSTGSAGTVNIRGVGSGNKVLMLFDGQPQWAGIYGHSLPDTYVASDVDKVEVIRGPGSLLYGSNAMGGVVNIITRSQHEEGVSTHARAMYGSYNTQKYMINNGVRSGKFNSFISLNHDRTDGHRDNSKFNITNGFVKIGYDISSHYSVVGDISAAYYDLRNPGKDTDPLLDGWMHIWRGIASVGVENKYQKYSGAIRAFYSWGNHKINDGHEADEAAKDYLFRSTDFNYGVQAYESFFIIPNNQFTLGVDYKNWGGNAWNAFFSGERKDIITDKSVHELAGYAIMQQEFWNQFTLNAGVRYEHNSTYGSEWVPQAGFTWRPFWGNSIKASFSKGFRSPNMRELYITFGPGNKANVDLNPESMLNYEVSIGQYFWNNRIHAEVTAFYIDGKNMIQVDPQSGQLENVGKFYNKGIELDADIQVLRNLRFSTNYSFLHTNKEIVAAPKHKWFLEGLYTWKNLSITLNMQSIFGLYVSNLMKSEDYTLLNGRIAYKIGNKKQNITLFVKGENLTNTKYTINEGYPMPGAIAMGGFDFKF